MKWFLQAGLIVLIVCLFITPDIAAQESGTIQATATVVSTLSVAGAHNLLFGTVTPGLNKAVDKADAANAGAWTITGVAGAEVTLDFTLPIELVETVSSATMPIAFNNTDASYDDGTGGGQAAPVGVMDPNIVSTVDIGAGGSIWVWIGGTVQPIISQTGGSYAADIVLTVAYTGS